MTRAAPAMPAIDVEFPDIARWKAGNTGIAYVWRFAAPVPGPSVTIQALTHGNEVCGAICADWLLEHALRPTRGTLTVVFANVDAYARFDARDPFSSRCIDEDFNRLWTSSVLEGPRRSRELERARELRPVYDVTDHLLDLHSMTDPCVPLALAGRRTKGVALARAIGLPQHIVVDAGHAAGKRLRDYAAFDDPASPRSALLVECGQRFLAHFDMLDRRVGAEWLDAAPLPRQQVIEITDVVTIATDAFAFVQPVSGLEIVPEAGTLLARDGTTEVHTPHANAVLVMPTRRPRRGETAVRIGRIVE